MGHWDLAALAALAVACGLAAGGIALARGPGHEPADVRHHPGRRLQLSTRRFFDAPTGATFALKTTTNIAPSGEAEALGRTAASFGYGKRGLRAALRRFVLPHRLGLGRRGRLRGAMPGRADGALHHADRPHRGRGVLDRQTAIQQLPVAKRYQTSFENTCTCHRDTVASRANGPAATTPLCARATS